MTRSVITIILLVLLAFCPASVFAAASPQPNKEKSLGTFGAWRDYTYNEAGQTVCYMVATKIIKSSSLKNRGTPYIMITHRPIEASTDVLSYGAGTLLNDKHKIELNVGNSAFDLFSVRDIAWARDARTDHKIATAIRNNASARVTAMPVKPPKPAKGKKPKKIIPINDQFDLRGAVSAYHAISKACDVPEASPPKPTPKKTRQGKNRIKVNKPAIP